MTVFDVAPSIPETCYRLSCTTRALRGCTGRALGPKIVLNFLICPDEASIGCFNTYQLTPSEHGGVVSEPMKW